MLEALLDSAASEGYTSSQPQTLAAATGTAYRALKDLVRATLLPLRATSLPLRGP